jgi:hypothetical protein
MASDPRTYVSRYAMRKIDKTIMKEAGAARKALYAERGPDCLLFELIAVECDSTDMALSPKSP